MNEVSELVRIYLEEATHHKTKLKKEVAEEYYEKLLPRVDYVKSDDRIIGFVESWRLSFSQWGRLVSYAPFDIFEENVEVGPVCYLADIWIKDSYRKSSVLTDLKHKFFTRNEDADYFVGEALRKKSQPIKVFKRQEAFKKWIKE